MGNYENFPIFIKQTNTSRNRNVICFASRVFIFHCEINFNAPCGYTFTNYSIAGDFITESIVLAFVVVLIEILGVLRSI